MVNLPFARKRTRLGGRNLQGPSDNVKRLVRGVAGRVGYHEKRVLPDVESHKAKLISRPRAECVDGAKILIDSHKVHLDLERQGRTGLQVCESHPDLHRLPVRRYFPIWVRRWGPDRLKSKWTERGRRNPSEEKASLSIEHVVGPVAAVALWACQDRVIYGEGDVVRTSCELHRPRQVHGHAQLRPNLGMRRPNENQRYEQGDCYRAHRLGLLPPLPAVFLAIART